VLFLDNGTAIGGGVIVNQVATYRTSLLTPGRHVIQAIYAGDSTYGSASSSLQSMTVTPPATGGQFVSAPLLTASPANTLLVFDLDGDGIPDLVVPAGSGNVAIYKGKGDGTFSLYQTHAITGTVNQAVSTDLKGDGRPDIVLAGSAGVTTLLQA